MSTALTTFDPQVPAFFQQAKFLELNAKFAAGLSSGAPPRISFRASRFRLVSADGTETMVTENGGTTLDVVVLDANPGVSKFYYDKAYDANAEASDAAPACFSEDGSRPSARSSKPQHADCASCPHNVWGSKVTPTGSKVKACSDVKKLAVIPAANLGGDAYMLGIPGASLKAWSGLIASCARRNFPISAMVLRLGFNPEASFPQLTFTPAAIISQAQYEAIADLFGSEDVKALVGQNDPPHSGPFALTAPQQPAAAPAMPAQGQSAFIVPPAATVVPVAPPPGVQVPAHTMQAMQQPASPGNAVAQPAAAAPARRRGRPAAAPAAAPVVNAPAAAPISVAAVPPTSSSMDALLDKVMNGG